MDFSDEWKSQFPVGKVCTPPLLISGRAASSILGPLFFNPNPESLTLLFSSPSLFPPLLSPLPQLSLPSFLSSSPQNEAVSALSHNRLQFLHCPFNGSVIVFFSTGYNHDQIGFLVVLVKESGFDVFRDENNGVFVARNRFNHRICKILVNPVGDFSDFEGTSSVNVGYLLAFTMYSVHWFSVNVSRVSVKPVLSYLGFKLFKSCSVVCACWSPHLTEESVVLLQSGALFLFDLDDCVRTSKTNTYFKGKRLRVQWNEDSDGLQNCKWIGCEFSWHPRILIVARSDSVFLVDLRSDDCNISLLAKIDMLSLYVPVETEKFQSFCKVGSDCFNFVLASDSLLVLLDVRKPLMPVLQWAHGLDKPSYIDSLRLSELRSNPSGDMYEWANKSGYGIILGSFWTCEFRLFCYGPPLPGHSGIFTSKISTFTKSLYAWELPTDLLLSGRGCWSGTCLLRKEFSKDYLPKWTDWQQKEDMVLGFGILNKDFPTCIHELDEFGGFTLIRLMSSGKVEAQRYFACWDAVKKLEVAHGDSLLHSEDNLLCSRGYGNYKFPKRYKYLKLDYLYGHLNGNLIEVLDSKMKNTFNNLQEKDSFKVDFHEILCEKLKVCGLSRFRTSPAISVVFNDISLPASIREVALRRVWAGLPMELLQLAFSNYNEVLEVLMDQKKISLEFLVVPDLPQLPPFFLRKPSCRSNKWTQKVQRDDALVGPVLPLPILVTLHEFRNGSPYSEEEASNFSSEGELYLRCEEVMQVAHEMAVSDSGIDFNEEHAVSLADSRDETWVDSRKPKPFIYYRPGALDCSNKDHALRNCVYKDDKFFNLISKVAKSEPCPKDRVDSVAVDLGDDLCPIDLKYDTNIINNMPPESKAYNIIKRQFLRWQEGFSPYKDFCTQFKLREQEK
ncbi:uncharacterized protein LOC123205217 [Mangifera indica]|uniref:uncharacterized protein LOC123205217 n=1 Tax=Mangifera indica TaxID=29780 RepID=UPI001CF98AD8|nr:uncharacterized protein LOC123205217 [Mangifera indica]